MRKNVLFFVFIFSIVILFSINSKAQNDFKNPLFYVTDNSPVIDGIIDSVWMNYDKGILKNKLVGDISSDKDLSVSFKTIWDFQNLYILAEIQDESKINDSGNEFYKDDALEVFIDADNNKSTTYDNDDYAFLFRWNDTTIRGVNPQLAQAIKFVQKGIETGYVFEIQIPWISLGILNPSDGKKIGFDIHFNDDDNGGDRDSKLSWIATIDDSWKNPSLFGSISLSGIVKIPEQVQEPVFSVKHGFYKDPFDLEILSYTPGSTIRYTLDGTDPNTSKTSFIHTSPVKVRINPDVSKGRGKTPGVVVSASTEKTGNLTSKIITETYIFIEKVKKQSYPGWDWPSRNIYGQAIDLEMDSDVVKDPRYKDKIDSALLDIPSISIVTDLNNLFNPQYGIYVNAYGHGLDWERPASIELINPDKSNGFQIDAGLRIRGGYSRDGNNPKHGFRLLFRKEYGEASLKYPLFEKEGVEEFENMDLTTSQNYSWSYNGSPKNTLVREVFSRDLQKDMDQPYTKTRYYHLYVNGLYWGLYETEERPEASFAASYFGGKKGDYDVIKVIPGDLIIEATDGNLDAWKEFWDMGNIGFKDNTEYLKAQGLNPDGSINPSYKKLLDVDNLIDYMIGIYYTGDFDAPITNFAQNIRPNNYYAIFNHNNPDGFKFIRHDAEHSMHSLQEDRTKTYTAGDIFKYSNPQWLHQKLMENPDYALRFVDHVDKFFFRNGVLTPENVKTRLLSRINQIDMAIIAESARWGDAKTAKPFTKDDHWLPEINYLLNTYAPARTDIVLQQLIKRGWYPELREALLTKDDKEILPTSLQIIAGDKIKLTNPNTTGTILYTLDGSDPRLDGGSKSSKAIDGGKQKEIIISKTTYLRVRILDGTKWSPLRKIKLVIKENIDGLRITEINYNPQNQGKTDGQKLEFIELKNISKSEINLTGAALDDGIKYAFKENVILKAGEFLVLASDKSEFEKLYGFKPFDEYSGKLNNQGEKIILLNAAGDTVNNVKYNNKSPWPEEADGYGFSIVPISINPDFQQDEFAKWRSSSVINGTPGKDDLGTKVLPVYINEILTHTDPPQSDAIELYNPNTSDIDISGWFLTDNPDNQKKWKVPAGTVIPANGYKVFYEGHYNGIILEFNANEFGGDKGFALSSHGDEVYIYSANQQGNLTGFVHNLKFGEMENGVTFGRYILSTGEEHHVIFESPTLGAANTNPRVGPLIINKIMYHPNNEDFQYLEIKNISDKQVDLFDNSNPLNYWKLEGFGFVIHNKVSIPAGSSIYFVEYGIIINEFIEANQLPKEATVFYFEGKLSNNGEKLSIKKTVEPYLNTEGKKIIPFIEIEGVSYDNKSPWPSANGTGFVLLRKDPLKYGNDPINWTTELPKTGILTSSLEGITFMNFNKRIMATGGKLPYSYEISEGNLPNGFTFDKTNGKINGITYQKVDTKITVEITDADGTTTIKTIPFQIRDNKKPVTVNDSVIIYQNNKISIDMLGNDIDEDGDMETWKVGIISNPVNGKAVIGNDKSIYYVPNQNFIGIDEFSYSVSDSAGASTGKIKVIIKPFNQGDYQALVALYNSTSGDKWGTKTGWDLTSNSANNSWFGVTVEDGRVIKIELSNNRLKGAIPKEIGNLTKLQTLNLSGNTLSGEIPNEIGNMKELSVLYLSGNQLTGSIPKGIGNLNALVELDFNSNKLTGTIPAEIGNCINLIVIGLHFNSIEGKIPKEIGNLKKLIALILAYNALSGEVPPEIGTIASLSQVYLFKNRLTGEFPESFTNLSELIALRIESNEFTGIPDFSAIKFTTDNNDIQNNYLGINVTGNKLSFDDLEPNMSNFAMADQYRTQANIPVEKDTVLLNTGETFKLAVKTGGNHNLYQWFKNGKSLGNASENFNLEIGDITISDAAQYHCEVTNTIVTSCKIKYGPVQLLVDGSNSINNLNNESQFEVYQSESKIIVKLNPSISKSAGQIEIFDILGRNINIVKLNGSSEFQLDYKGNAKMLIVRVKADKEIFCKKIVIE